MFANRNPRNARRGGIAPLTCIFLVLVLGMVAFAVDISYMVMVSAELQDVADAAALAGTTRLGDNLVSHSLPTQSTANQAALRSAAVTLAKNTAKTYATYNNAGSVSMTLLDSDIDVGYTNSGGVFTSYSANNTNYPNTVKVIARRDTSANTPLSLFFAPVLGISKMDMTATATAVLYGGTINSFKVGSVNSGMLPVTFDVNDWNNFLNNGKDRDGAVNTDSSGNPILQIYGTVKNKGAFGLLSLNDDNVGASTIADWIHVGMRPEDTQALTTAGLIPLSTHNQGAWDWQGDPGFKSTNAMDINQHVDRTYMLPLFTPVVRDTLTNGTVDEKTYQAEVGNGSNHFYNIVQFVGVKIRTSPHDNKEVWIQPALISDPNMNLTNVTPANGNTYTTAATVKLTH